MPDENPIFGEEIRDAITTFRDRVKTSKTLAGDSEAFCETLIDLVGLDNVSLSSEAFQNMNKRTEELEARVEELETKLEKARQENLCGGNVITLLEIVLDEEADAKLRERIQGIIDALRFYSTGLDVEKLLRKSRTP